MRTTFPRDLHGIRKNQNTENSGSAEQVQNDVLQYN